MGTAECRIDSTWANGTARIRPGESIVFEGNVTGINPDVTVTFHADGEGTYRQADASVEAASIHQHSARLIVRHVEMALMDAGFTIDPKAAPEDYEPDNGPEEA
jgi:hypothetical protein